MGEEVKHKYKKYILFQFDDYYPSGGLWDIKGSFDTIEEAKDNWSCRPSYDQSEIVDRDTWEIVWEE